MKRLLFASFLTTLSCTAAASISQAAIDSQGTAPQADRVAQLYMGDTPMATTYGRGTVTAPADTATLNYTFSRNDYSYGYSDPEMNTEVSQFSASDREQLTAFFVAQGIPPENITIDLSAYEMYATLEIRNPDQAMLMAIEDATYQFVEANGSLYFTNNYSTCSIEEFADLEAEARLKAIADSRARIDAMAAAFGAEVGSILSMFELHGYMPVVSSSCSAPDGDIGVPEVTIELGVMTTFELID